MLEFGRALSEYHAPVQKNTVHDKPIDSMSAGEVLRLIYVTGTEEPNAAPDPYAFGGGLNNLTAAEVRSLTPEEG